jgi:hypothetical protein
MKRVALAGLWRRRQRLALNGCALLTGVAPTRATDFIFTGVWRDLTGFKILRHDAFLS